MQFIAWWVVGMVVPPLDAVPTPRLFWLASLLQGSRNKSPFAYDVIIVYVGFMSQCV